MHLILGVQVWTYSTVHLHSTQYILYNIRIVGVSYIWRAKGQRDFCDCYEVSIIYCNTIFIGGVLPQISNIFRKCCPSLNMFLTLETEQKVVQDHRLNWVCSVLPHTVWVGCWLVVELQVSQLAIQLPTNNLYFMSVPMFVSTANWQPHPQ